MPSVGDMLKNGSHISMWLRNGMKTNVGCHFSLQILSAHGVQDRTKKTTPKKSCQPDLPP